MRFFVSGKNFPKNERYNEKLDKVSGITILSNDEKLKRNFAYYPILIEKEKFGYSREDIIEWLSKEDIFARKYFYPLVSENKEFPKDLCKNTPIAFKYSREVLCLPMYAELPLDVVDKICNIIIY